MAEKVYYCSTCQNGNQYDSINNTINNLNGGCFTNTETITSEFYKKAYDVFIATRDYGTKDDYIREPHSLNFLLGLGNLKDQLISHSFYDDIKNTLNNNGGCWKKEKNGSRWWFPYNNGGYPANAWIKYDNQYYYFDGEGWMVTGTRTIHGRSYTFNSSGVLTSGVPASGESIVYSNDSNTDNTGNVIYGSYWTTDLKVLLQNIKLPASRYYEQTCCCENDCSSDGWYCPSYCGSHCGNFGPGPTGNSSAYWACNS